MENEVVRRLAVSSSAWLGGGRCAQGKRGAKASEEKGDAACRASNQNSPQNARKNMQRPAPRDREAERQNQIRDCAARQKHERQRLAEAEKGSEEAKRLATGLANWGNAPSACERAKPPNENKMSCHERERAWRRVKGKWSRKTRWYRRLAGQLHRMVRWMDVALQSLISVRSKCLLSEHSGDESPCDGRTEALLQNAERMTCERCAKR